MRQVKEIQSFRDNSSIFILISVLFAGVLIGVSIPFETQQQTDQEAVIGLSIAVLVTLGSYILILKMKFELTVLADGLSFTFQPFLLKSKQFKLTEIANWSIENHKWYHGLGYKRRFNRQQVFVMSPGKVLAITTKDGNNYRFGINRPELVKRFIEENWENKNTLYG